MATSRNDIDSREAAAHMMKEAIRLAFGMQNFTDAFKALEYIKSLRSSYPPFIDCQIDEVRFSLCTCDFIHMLELLWKEASLDVRSSEVGHNSDISRA